MAPNVCFLAPWPVSRIQLNRPFSLTSLQPRRSPSPSRRRTPARAPRATVAQDAAESALLAANARFYDAFRAQSVPGMMSLWLPASDQVSVAHPLRGLIVGADEVASAWAGMFALGAVVSCEVEVVRVEAGRNVGWVLCRQLVESARGKLTVGGERIATNIFHLYKGEWKMAHHSAAPVLMPEPLPDVPGGDGGGGGGGGGAGPLAS
jgi:ketosteroid isomerase-like protein